jgi:hypothetical protein
MFDGEGLMRPRTIADVVNFSESLRTFHDEVGAFLGAEGVMPLPGSPAAREIASRPDRSEQLLIERAADHLMAFAKALDEPAQTLALWTAARGALEVPWRLPRSRPGCSTRLSTSTRGCPGASAGGSRASTR